MTRTSPPRFRSLVPVLLMLVFAVLNAQALGGVEALLDDLDDFVLANGRSGQAFGNRFNVPIRILINNSRLAFIQGARGSILDKTLEALRCELLVLLDQTFDFELRGVVHEAIRRVDGIREAGRAASPVTVEFAEDDPQPIAPPAGECRVEIRRVAGAELRRLLGGSFILERGAELILQADAMPPGGDLRWSIEPNPADFNNGSFTPRHCAECSVDQAVFVAPTEEEGSTAYRVTADYTAPDGRMCGDVVIFFAR